MEQLDVIRFPFLGACKSGEPFQYLLLEIDQKRARIALFNWLVNRFSLSLQEEIDLFIPKYLTPVYQFRHNTPGIVSAVSKENSESYFYEISFEDGPASTIHSPIELAKSLPLDMSIMDMLIRLIKDSLILKQGVFVYLKHLAPYFSRIIDYYHEHYQSLKKIIFEDIKNRIKKNEEVLTALYEDLKELKNPSNIPLILDLESLRDSMESEISLDFFLIAFAHVESSDELLALLQGNTNEEQIKFKYSYMNYLIAIKQLEKRLYSNYNQIVLIYLRSI